MSCRFCLTESTESYFGSWCARCHRLQRLISLFGGDKVMSILENVLIVDKDTQKEKINDIYRYNLKNPSLVIYYLLPCGRVDYIL